MKKTTKNELTNRIRDLMADFWVGLLDVVDPEVSFDEMPCSYMKADDINTYVEKNVIEMMDANGLITDGNHYKATAFYTGGNIWICAKYLDDVHYVTVSNCDDEYVLNYFINDEEDRSISDDEFPCYSLERSVELEDMTKEDLKIWKELHEVLINEMH
jgi:hypothetical protein